MKNLKKNIRMGMDGSQLELVSGFKYLGFVLDKGRKRWGNVVGKWRLKVLHENLLAPVFELY